MIPIFKKEVLGEGVKFVERAWITRIAVTKALAYACMHNLDEI